MNKETTTLSCGEELTIAAVKDFQSSLREATRPDTPLVLDAAPLVRVDGAGVQLLTCLFIDARRRGYSIQWQTTSEVLQRAARLLGVDELLELSPN